MKTLMNYIPPVLADVLPPTFLYVAGGAVLPVVGGLTVSIGVVLFVVLKRKKNRRQDHRVVESP